MITIEELKEATPQALDELITLSRSLHADERTMSPEELQDFLKNTNFVLMIARDEGRIIGMAGLYIILKIGNKKAYIEDVIVDAAYRGQGLGEKLMRALIDIARMRGVNSISLTSRPERTAAQALYEKIGFIKHKTDVFKLTLT